MPLRLILTACSLLALAACATPTQSAPPELARDSSAQVGDIIAAAPGEVLYAETATVFAWALHVAEDASIGPYTVEAGEYPLRGLSEQGYFFSVGDDCAGEPAVVTRSRFADAPEHLMLTADGARTCVVPLFDQARCAPRVGAMRSERLPGQGERVTSLIFDGLDEGPDGQGREARFTLVSETALDRTERALTASVPGLVVTGFGEFEVIDADETGVTVMVRQPINDLPELALPSLEDAGLAR